MTRSEAGPVWVTVITDFICLGRAIHAPCECWNTGFGLRGNQVSSRVFTGDGNQTTMRSKPVDAALVVVLVVVQVQRSSSDYRQRIIDGGSPTTLIRHISAFRAPRTDEVQARSTSLNKGVPASGMRKNCRCITTTKQCLITYKSNQVVNRFMKVITIHKSSTTAVFWHKTNCPVQKRT